MGSDASNAGEAMIRRLLLDINPTWIDVKETMNRDAILSAFRAKALWRMKSAEEGRLRSGLRTKWEFMDVNRMVDELLGLDIVFSPDGRQLFGIDVTLNGNKVFEKVGVKHKIQLGGAYASLGITKIAIIHVDSNSQMEWGYGLLSPEEKEVLKDEVENFVYDMDDNGGVLDLCLKL